ncbi:MAG: hypothetical protein M1818_006513 [Claussenomyces sp. TS43310]|nr:MAG: hypothetical protein M1818_006513 [Claussenomyces sp. TS43310]
MHEPQISCRSAHFIEDLSRSDIDALTQLLALAPRAAPSEDWLRDQSRLLSTFPPTLHRPTSSLLRLAMHLPFTPARAILCRAHKLLNPHLIRRIFLQISAEVTTRQRRLQAVVTTTTTTTLDADAELQCLTRRLSSVNSLWMAPEVYRVVFQVQPEEPRLERLPGGCEACILACVGGSRQILTDLQASVLGRRKKRRQAPRLLPLLEAWIAWLGESEAIDEESGRLARAIRRVRRQAWKAKREARRETPPRRRRDDELLLLATGEEEEEEEEKGEKDMNTTHGEENEAEAEADFEGSIISFYRNIMSTASLVNPQYATNQQTLSMMHPAFRDSFIPNHSLPPPASEPTIRTHLVRGQQQGHRGSIYTQSMYSTDSGFCSADVVDEPFAAQLQRKAEDHARAYRTLLGERGEARDDGKVGSMRDSPRATRWSDMYKD